LDYSHLGTKSPKGPIIRINPEELHVNDPSFYDYIYVGPTRRTNKWPWSAQMFGTYMAAVGTVDHETHRQRRAALNPFFSKKSVTQLEPIIQAQIDKLYTKLKQARNIAQLVNLSDAFACLSADIISDCAFGKTYGMLDSADFAPEWRKFMMELSLGTHLMKQFGWAYRVAMAITPWLLTLLHPLSRKLNQLRQSRWNVSY
jgi:cytochrome P450